MIFPSMMDESLNAQYEGFIKTANAIWDEFTTGKTKKKPEPVIEVQKKKKVVHSQKKVDKAFAEKKKEMTSFAASLVAPTPILTMITPMS